MGRAGAILRLLVFSLAARLINAIETGHHPVNGDDDNVTKAFAAVPPGCSEICDASWGPIYRRIDTTMEYMLSKFNTSFDYVIDELDDMLDSSSDALQTKMQNHVVELAEQQRRIARMHRQLAAAVDNGAVPDVDHVSQLLAEDATSAQEQPKYKIENIYHEIEHGESWLMLVGQVAVAAVLGTGYERLRADEAPQKYIWMTTWRANILYDLFKVTQNLDMRAAGLTIRLCMTVVFCSNIIFLNDTQSWKSPEKKEP